MTPRSYEFKLNFQYMIPKQDCSYMYTNKSVLDGPASGDAIVSVKAALLMVIILLILYLPVLRRLHKSRRHQLVLLKSPKLITICGAACLLDSIMVISLATDWNYTSLESESYAKCWTSIVATFVFHYSAYFSLVFRALRVLKAARLEKQICKTTTFSSGSHSDVL